ncbi:MAG TPA: Asp-tRNA(Asn)/Glu-tRNA(Gln) amidotransferase subunit GatC [Candidatus Paceibacterota bacterium]|nr:Asp-tRNA(Asn)/Glu-tRNA(Gln) amidotransferase subunit GatC [Candidatus Paceibacterota bacterium]
MATTDDVKKLAELARIDVPEERLAKFATEFDQILAYVGQLDELSVQKGEPLLPYENIMRKDGEPTPKGTWTKKLVEQFPDAEGDYLSVKQILSHE